MNTTHNPQAVADQMRKNYRAVTSQLGLLGLDSSVPEAVRAIAEKTVAQTREIYDHSSEALEASITKFEKTFEVAGQDAAAFNRKIIELSKRNVNSSFDLAKSLASAKDLTEVVELQAAYWQKQFSALTVQAEEVRALSTKVMTAAAEPIKTHAARGADEVRKAH
ncbi:MAG: phasin family protein [Methyloceanibacter sp.]